MAVLLRERTGVSAADRYARRVTAERQVRLILLDLALLATAVVVTHLAVSGFVPSGGDGGNWLALARELTGESVMSADVAYEPVFIGLVAMLRPVFGLIGGLVAAAFLAELALLTGVYLTGRQMGGRIQGLISAGVVLLLGYRLEAYAWGAYPQILALGFALIALWLLGRYMAGGRRRPLIIALVACVVTLLTHKLVGGLLMAAAPVAALHLSWQRRWDRAVLKRSLLAVGSFAVVGVGFALSWWADTTVGMEPSLNPLGLGLAEQLERAFPASVVPWVVIGLLALAGFGLRSWRRPASVVVAAGFGWLIPSVAVFLLTGEPRALIQAQVALIPVAVGVAFRLISRLRAMTGWKRAGSVVAAILLAATLGSLALTGLNHYEQSSDWYRVVGRAQLTSLSRLGALADDGDLVVASRGPNGNPIGWWVEGLIGVPTYTSIDEEFLSFPDEREQSELAAAVFKAPPEQAASMLDELGADYLILDRRGPDAGWLGGGEPIGLETVSDGTLLILEAPDGS